MSEALAEKVSRQLPKLVTALSVISEDWKSRYAALETIETLAREASDNEAVDQLEPQLTSLAQPLAVQMGDLRSEVVRQCGHTISVLAQTLGEAFSKCATKLIPLLIPKAAIANKIIRDYTVEALLTTVKFVHSKQILASIEFELKGTKNKVVRQVCVQLLHVLLAHWPMQKYSKHVTTLEEDITLGLKSPDRPTRTAAAHSFWLFSGHFPDRKDKLFATFDARQRKFIEEAEGSTTEISDIDSTASEDIKTDADPSSVEEASEAESSSDSIDTKSDASDPGSETTPKSLSTPGSGSKQGPRTPVKRTPPRTGPNLASLPSTASVRVSPGSGSNSAVRPTKTTRPTTAIGSASASKSLSNRPGSSRALASNTPGIAVPTSSPNTSTGTGTSNVAHKRVPSSPAKGRSATLRGPLTTGTGVNASPRPKAEGSPTATPPESPHHRSKSNGDSSGTAERKAVDRATLLREHRLLLAHSVGHLQQLNQLVNGEKSNPKYVEETLALLTEHTEKMTRLMQMFEDHIKHPPAAATDAKTQLSDNPQQTTGQPATLGSGDSGASKPADTAKLTQAMAPVSTQKPPTDPLPLKKQDSEDEDAFLKAHNNF